MEVLSLVPRKDLILNCRLVCSRWRDLVDLPILWKRKCQRMGFHPETSDGAFQDWRTFCFLRCKRNLVKNPCGEADRESWQTKGRKWTASAEIGSSVPSRFQMHCGRIPIRCPPQDVRKCFMFTCTAGYILESGTKTQRISLTEEGYSDRLMDETRPRITVKDWEYHAWMSHCELKLLSSSFDVLQECSLGTRDYNWWNEVSHVFEDYPPGVRHIEVGHELYTREYVKITGSSVTIDPEERKQDLRSSPRQPLCPEACFPHFPSLFPFILSHES